MSILLNSILKRIEGLLILQHGTDLKIRRFVLCGCSIWKAYKTAVIYFD